MDGLRQRGPRRDSTSPTSAPPTVRQDPQRGVVPATAPALHPWMSLEQLQRMAGNAAVLHMLGRRLPTSTPAAGGPQAAGSAHAPVAVQRGDPEGDEAGLPDVDADSFAGIEIGGPSTPEAADLKQWYLDEIRFNLERASAEFATGMAGVSEGEEQNFWMELEESGAKRARYLRVALLLREGEFDTAAELGDVIAHAERTARDEGATLAEDASLVDEYPEAFPATWADRVRVHLQPPSDLEPEQAAAALGEQSKLLADVAATIPEDVYEHGLPVPLAQALTLKEFSFRANLASLDQPESLRAYAVQARDWMEAWVVHALAKGWISGKRELVTDLEDGNKVMDPAEWDRVSARTGARPSMRSLAEDAVDEGVELSVLGDADVIPGWEYEVALARNALAAEFLTQLAARLLIHNHFHRALAATDSLVDAAGPEERLVVATRWADNWGYNSAAFDVVVTALEENLDQIAIDVAKDALISAIPVVGWLWNAKELVQEAVDLYDAGEAVAAARGAVEEARTLIGLQRAAARMSMAEVGAAATVAVTAVSEGISLAAKHIGGGKGEGGAGEGGTASTGAGESGTTPEAAVREGAALEGKPPDSPTPEGEAPDAAGPLSTVDPEAHLAPSGHAPTAGAHGLTPLDAGIQAALVALRHEFPILAQAQLDTARVRRIATIKDPQKAKGQLLEELMSALLHDRLQTPEGRAELGLSEARAGERVFIEGHRITMGGKQVTDGIIGYFDGPGEFRVEAVLEAKAGAPSAKGLSSSHTAITSLARSEKLELVREIREAAQGELDEFVAENHPDALDALRAGDYEALPDSVLGAIVGDPDLRHSVVDSMSEAGQIRRDVERLFPNVGSDEKNLGPIDFDQTVIDVEGIGDVAVKVSPTQTRFIGVVPSDVPTAKLHADLEAEFNFKAEQVGISSADLAELVTRLRGLAPLFEGAP